MVIKSVPPNRRNWVKWNKPHYLLNTMFRLQYFGFSKAGWATEAVLQTTTDLCNLVIKNMQSTFIQYQRQKIPTNIFLFLVWQPL